MLTPRGTTTSVEEGPRRPNPWRAAAVQWDRAGRHSEQRRTCYRRRAVRPAGDEVDATADRSQQAATEAPVDGRPAEAIGQQVGPPARSPVGRGPLEDGPLDLASHGSILPTGCDSLREPVERRRRQTPTGGA